MYCMVLPFKYRRVCWKPLSVNYSHETDVGNAGGFFVDAMLSGMFTPTNQGPRQWGWMRFSMAKPCGVVLTDTLLPMYNSITESSQCMSVIW